MVLDLAKANIGDITVIRTLCFKKCRELQQRIIAHAQKDLEESNQMLQALFKLLGKIPRS